jgi:hypothetical protein
VLCKENHLWTIFKRDCSFKLYSMGPKFDQLIQRYAILSHAKRHSAGPHMYCILVYISANSYYNSKIFWSMNQGPWWDCFMKKICLATTTMYMYIMDALKTPPPPLYRLFNVPHCISAYRPIGAPNTSSYYMKNVGGKRESLPFYCPDRPLYIEIVTLRAMFSLPMLEQVY